MINEENLSVSLKTGFIDYHTDSDKELRPKLLVNKKAEEKKILSTILNLLKNCDEFKFCVAFITTGGLACILETLIELNNRHVKGQILTSTYQNFTQPEALERILRNFPNIELKIQTDSNLHAKSYIFKSGDNYTAIVGSSNLTQNALCLNNEWNLKFTSLADGEIIKSLLERFNNEFNNSTSVDEKFLSDYQKTYDLQFTKINKLIEDNIFSDESVRKIKPNQMQQQALDSLKELRAEGKKKALIISATGTGKTFLSAFDALSFKPKRLLFIVHRERIAKAALASFKKVFGNSISTGLYTGNNKDLDKDFIFSTIQTVAKEENLKELSHNQPDYFDYIVIDEAHHLGASSYQTVLNYFTPKFLLGMTATPERTDSFDIFKAFNYDIAYEIRLNHALEHQMLVPFHYYGVSDITLNGELLDDKASFEKLTASQRVKNIIKATKLYGCDHGRIKGLMFCSSVEECLSLSKSLNEQDIKAVALSGDSTDEQRERAIQRLESDNPNDCIDYIITRDIFNEGVDIPCVNQVVLLRPTQSAIVFVQQLGRGLRKSDGKEFLTVIDFIGNYSNNYLVPIALYGDNSYNKDRLRKLITTGSVQLPGASTVDFDVITKENIFKSIEQANVTLLKDLKNDYQLLKYKLGHVPTMMDFVNHGSRDPFLYVSYGRSSYYSFVNKIDPNAIPIIDTATEKHLSFFSLEIANGKRATELVLLQALLNEKEISVDKLKHLVSSVSVEPNNSEIVSALNVINGTFFIKNDFIKYSIPKDGFVSFKNNSFMPSRELQNIIENKDTVKYLKDIIDYGINKFKQGFKKHSYRDGFVLGEKYSRKDVCRILQWTKDQSSTVYGYRINKETDTCPIFVTYKKNDTVSASTKYEDYFLSTNSFHWMTRNKVKKDSPESIAIRKAKDSNLKISLFVKKSDDESSDFYYISDVIPIREQECTIENNKGQTLPIMNFDFLLKDPVTDHLYDYLTDKKHKNR